jgi:hypothetical protein
MPWGYTVNCARILFIFNTDIFKIQGIFELENGGGLFGESFTFFWNTTVHAFYTAAREFNSKAAKAIWDLNGIVLLTCSQSTQSPTFDQASMLPLDTYLESVLQVLLIQVLSALPLPLNCWPHGTNAKAN